MPIPDIEDIVQRIDLAQSDFHRLVLIVGGVGSGKTALLQRLGGRLEAPMVNVNLTLSQMLLEVPSGRRALQVSRSVSQILSGVEASCVILDNTEMLFHRDLHTDPMKLFRNLSRNRMLVVGWSGSLDDDGALTYASPGWPEYRKYPAASGAITVQL